MSIRGAWPVIGAAVLWTMVLVAHSGAQAPTGSMEEMLNADEAPITLVGCIQREADYRRTHDIGRGGVAATGIGRGNEYVLINSSRVPSGTAAADMDCSFQWGPGYELTGERERDLEPHVGSVVQISGMLKESEFDVASSRPAQPTGGFDPLGQDLRLQEVNLTSFQEVAPAAQLAFAEAPSSKPAVAEEAQAIGTAGVQELPRTASPLPVAGILGLLSLGAAFALRARRRG